MKVESIPESTRGEFITRYRDENDRKVKIALHASYRSLKELGNEMALEFISAYEKDIKSLLEIRNFSILAHGFNPVKSATYSKLRDIIIKFSGGNENGVPRFPVLKI